MMPFPPGDAPSRGRTVAGRDALGGGADGRGRGTRDRCRGSSALRPVWPFRRGQVLRRRDMPAHATAAPLGETALVELLKRTAEPLPALDDAQFAAHFDR